MGVYPLIHFIGKGNEIQDMMGTGHLKCQEVGESRRNKKRQNRDREGKKKWPILLKEAMIQYASHSKLEVSRILKESTKKRAQQA